MSRAVPVRYSVLDPPPRGLYVHLLPADRGDELLGTLAVELTVVCVPASFDDLFRFFFFLVSVLVCGALCNTSNSHDPVCVLFLLLLSFVVFVHLSGLVSSFRVVNVCPGPALFSFMFSLAVLVIACPCAVGLAAPTAILVSERSGRI